MTQSDSKIYDKLWSEDWQTLQKVGPLTHNRYRLMLRELPSDLGKTPRIIDVGCGRGTFLELLRERYPDGILHGIEYSEEGRKSAREDIREGIQVGDVDEISAKLVGNSYDLVICSEVLEHLQEPQRALNSIVSLLKPKGLALLTVPCGMRYWSKEDVFVGHYRRFELKEFASLVEGSGLKIERHYGGGGLFGLIYYYLISLIGSERVNRTEISPLSEFISKMLQKLFLFDDLFCSSYGIQIITRARKLCKKT